MSFNNLFSRDDGNFGCFEERDDGDCAAFADYLPSTRHSQSAKSKKSLNSQVDSFAEFPALPVHVLDSDTFEISLGARVNSIVESSATDINTRCILLQEESQNCEEFAGPFFDEENEGRPSISATNPLLLDPPTPHWDSGRSSAGAAPLFLAPVKIAKGKEQEQEVVLNKVLDNTYSPTSGPSEPLSYPDINFGSSTKASNIGIGQLLLSQQGFTKDAFEDRYKAAVQRRTAHTSCSKFSLGPPKRDTVIRDRSLESRALMEELIKVNKDDMKKSPPKRILPAITTVPSSQRPLTIASSPRSSKSATTRLLVRDTLLSCPSPSRSRRKVGVALFLSSPRSKPKTSRRSPSPVSSPRYSDRDRASSSSRSRTRLKADSNPRRSRTMSSSKQQELSSKAGVDSPYPRPTTRRVSPSPARSSPSTRPERRYGAESPPRRPRKLAVDLEWPSAAGRARRRSSIGADSAPRGPPRQQQLADSSIGANSPSRRPRKLVMAATDLEILSPSRSRRSSGESPSRQPTSSRKSSTGDLEIHSPRPRRNPINIGGASPRCARANDDNEIMQSRRPKPRRAVSPARGAQHTEENARHAPWSPGAVLPQQDKEEEQSRTSSEECLVGTVEQASGRKSATPSTSTRSRHKRRVSAHLLHASEEEASRTSSSEECLVGTIEQSSGRKSPRERQNSEKVDDGETWGDCASNEHPLPPLTPILTPRARKSRVLCEIPTAAASRRRRRKSPSTSYDDSPTEPGTAAVSTTTGAAGLPAATPSTPSTISHKRRVSAHLLHASEERAKSIAKARREASQAADEPAKLRSIHT